jgi:hypothetical protein
MGTKSTAATVLLSLASLAFTSPLFTSPLFGDVKLPAIIGDHMVLQRDAKVPIAGQCRGQTAIHF